MAIIISIDKPRGRNDLMINPFVFLPGTVSTAATYLNHMKVIPAINMKLTRVIRATVGMDFGMTPAIMEAQIASETK